MTPYDEYDPETGESRASVWQRQARERDRAAANFVSPAPAPLATRQPQTIDAPAWLVQAQPLDVANAWQAQQGAKESSDPITRAKGLRIRVLPFLGLFGLAGVAVGGAVWLVAGTLPGAALAAVLTFSVAGFIVYARLNVTDYQYSREGTERHKVDTAAGLAHAQMANDHELRRLALESYLRTIERSEQRNEGKR